MNPIADAEAPGGPSSSSSSPSSSPAKKPFVASRSSVERYLRQRGLTKYANRFFDFGVENVDDLLDQVIVTDDALVNDLGMSSHDIVAFRGPPMEAQEMDYGHMSPTRMAS